MSSKTKNVKLGVARVYFDGNDLGYTKGGVDVEVTTETKKVMVDQFGSTEINEYITGRSCQVTLPLAETTLDNLARIMPGATLVESGGSAATGTITFAGNPSEDDTITLNGVTFTFKGTASGETQVDIGVDLPTTLDNLVTKANAATDASVTVATYTENGTDTFTVTYDENSVDGNSYTLAASAATVSGATLSGGVDSTKRVDVKTGVGQSLLEIAKELRLHPKAKDNSDQSDDFWIPLAATSGAVQYGYKLDEERIYNVVFTAYANSADDMLFKVGDKSA